MSGHNRQKNNGRRNDKKTQARTRDFEQPVVNAESLQSAGDTSNFTDGEIVGPDWKRKVRSERG